MLLLTLWGEGALVVCALTLLPNREPLCSRGLDIQDHLQKQVSIVPHHNRERGFNYMYFLVPKKTGGLRQILDLHCLNRHSCKHFCKLTMKQMFELVKPGNWFASTDLRKPNRECSEAQ